MTIPLIFSFVFLFQDFLQVLVMGIFIVPDIFLLCVIMLALMRGGIRDKQITMIWLAFIGGLIWDLRWTNLPGLTAGFNGLAVAVSILLWYKAPAQGRTTLLFAVLALSAHVFSGLVHSSFWSVPTQAALRQFAVQQILTVPVLMILCYIFRRRMTESDV